MKKMGGFALAWRLGLGAGLVWAGPASAFGQGPNTYQITPDKTTMLIGEERPFRMVDQNGHEQHKVTWSVSDEDALQVVGGDEMELISRRAGEFRITARTDFAVAEATVNVVDGPILPTGTVKWASGKKDGCTTTKLIKAVQRPGGPAVFEQSVCADGEYIAAYTSDGVQMWRRKMSDNGAGAPSDPGGNDYESVGSRLETKSPSVCDAVSVGMEQEKIREMLAQQKLTFREEPGGGRVWLVDEASTQCKLSFDEKGVLVKKKKVFVVE
jgi:hypothetical protein